MQENNLYKLKNIVNEIKDENNMSRGKLSGKIREFDRYISNLDNKELIEISDYISSLIEDTDDSTSLEKLLDSALENITGTK